MEEKWFYLDYTKPAGEQQQGPYPFYMIEKFAAEGLIQPDTLVWREGLKSWTPWKQIAPKPDNPPQEPQYPTAIPQITPVPELVAVYAPFGMRLAATLVDLLFLSMVNALLLIIYTLVFRIPESLLRESLLIHLPDFILNASYQIWFTWQYGGTPGKMLLGLRVVSHIGKPLTLGRSIARYLASWLSALSLGIGFLMILFDPMRRALHDRLAGTRVIMHTVELHREDDRDDD